MQTRPTQILLALLCLSIGLAFSPLQAQTAPDPSASLEDLVRSWSQGLSEQELLQKVERASPPIEMDPEIAEELKRAGFPASVLALLQSRSDAACAEGADCGANSEASGVAESSYSVPIVFFDATLLAAGNETPAARTVRLRDSLPRSLRETLGNAAEDVRITDISLYVLLTNPTEVPDQWQAHTPLGDDGRIPRHKMLLFLGGAVTQERSTLKKRFRSMLGDRSNLLELTLPESASLELPNSEPAELVIGLAGKVGNSHFAISEPRALSLEPTPEGSKLILTWKPARSAFQLSSFDLTVQEPTESQTESD